MSLRMLRQYIRALGRTPVGDARLFQRAVAVPQIFVFIVLITTGTFLNEPSSASIVRLFAVGYLLSIAILVRSNLQRFSLRFLTVHCIGLLLLMCCSTLILRGEPLLQVFLPAAGVVFALAGVPLTPVAALWLCTVIATVVALFWGIDSLLVPQTWNERARGPLLVALAIVAVLARSLFRKTVPTMSLDDAASFEGGARSAMFPARSPSPGRAGRSEAEEANQFYREELRLELVWKLPLVCLGWWTCVAVFCRAELAVDALLLALFLALMAAQAVLLLRFKSLQKPADLLVNAGLAFGVGYLSWIVLFDDFGSRVAGDALLALLVLLVASVPLPLGLAAFLPLAAPVLSFVHFEAPAQAAFSATVASVAGVIAAVSSFLTYHLLSVRAGSLLLRRSIESGVSTEVLIESLARQILLVAGVDRVLLVGGRSGARIFTVREVIESNVDVVFANGLEERVNALHIDEGTLALTDLGGQFLPALADWFRSPPQRLMYLRVRAILEERAEDVLLVVPVRMRLYLIGLERLFRSLLCLSSPVRSALAATRSRFLSSDVLLETQRVLAERDTEFGQVVHLVNNIAQDISIQCEAIPRGSQVGGDTAEAVRLVESLARNLSAGVSDIKVQRELLRMGTVERVDQVDLEVLLDELRTYGVYREHRRGDTFEIVDNVSEGAVLRVASREFLHTGLRALLRMSAARMPQGGHVRIEARAENGLVRLDICDTGTTVAATGDSSDDLAGSAAREQEYFEALARLAERSGGWLRREAPPQGFLQCFSIALPASSRSTKVRVEEGHWALLVDDNPQVTTFYARVAEALNLKYFSAGSVEEAEANVREHGRPRIVITDIQLGAGSGLDLVRSLRKQFGGSLPVIVVSGHTAEALEKEVSEAGATKYLVKPVGRAKLFSEIRALLSL